jgi:hypothetical protein
VKSAPEQMPFDQVIVVDDGMRRTLTVDSFLRMPVHERVRHVLERSVEFFLQGQPIDRKQALASLRARETNER